MRIRFQLDEEAKEYAIVWLWPMTMYSKRTKDWDGRKINHPCLPAWVWQLFRRVNARTFAARGMK